MSVYIVALSWSSWHTRSQRARVSVHLGSPPRDRQRVRDRSIASVYGVAHIVGNMRSLSTRYRERRSVKLFGHSRISHISSSLKSLIARCSLPSFFSLSLSLSLFFSFTHSFTFIRIHTYMYIHTQMYARDNHTHTYIHVHFFSHHHSCLLFFLLPSPSRYFKRQRGRVRLFARKSTVCI